MQQKLKNPAERRFAIGAGVVAGACWGVSFLAPRALTDVSPTTISLFRFLFFGATSVFALVLRRKVRPRIDLRAARMAFGLSLAGYSLYYALLALGVQGIGVTFATAIIALLPLTILLVSTPYRNWGRLIVPIGLIAVGGLLVPVELFGEAYSHFLGRSPLERMLGLGATVSALGLWTVFAVSNARYLEKFPAWKPLDWAGVLGVASALTAIGIFLLAERENAVNAFFAALGDSRVLGWTAFMGIVGAWISSGLWNFASRVLPGAALGMLLVFESVFGLAFGFLYDGRGPALREGIAAACLIIGALVGLRLIGRQPSSERYIE